MKHKIKRVLKKLLRPITYLFEDDHAPTYKAWKESVDAYEASRKELPLN